MTKKNKRRKKLHWEHITECFLAGFLLRYCEHIELFSGRYYTVTCGVLMYLMMVVLMIYWVNSTAKIIKIVKQKLKLH